MILFPAVDIRGGQAVRLFKGDYAKETVYAADPADAAVSWQRQGALYLHVVDLDGARGGGKRNLDHITRIGLELDIPFEVGGGLRDAESVAGVLRAGADRVVLGTKAQSDPDFVGELVERHGPEAVVAGIDTREGKVSVQGWEQSTGVDPADLIDELARRGVRRFIFTPVEVDGTLEGPGIDELRSAASAAAVHEADVIYSGGIGTLAHLATLAGLGISNLEGVIVGRALYEGVFSVEDGQAALAR